MRNLTMRWTAVACCALSACLVAPAAARAQGSPPPTAADDDVAGDNARAAQLYREGNLAFDQKRWAEAELLYLKAWALMRSFDIAANLGHAQLKLNKPRSAATFFAFALRTAPPSVKPEQIARMRDFLEQARKQVGAVRLQGTDMADAEVFVDGERVPAEEVRHEIYVEPGEHRIVIRRAGYEETAIRVVAAAGVRETVPVAMKPLEVKAPEAKTPEAKAPVAGGTPVAGGAPVVGKEKAKAPAAGTGARGEEPRSWVPVIALGAASAVGLGVAVGFTVASNGASADMRTQRASIYADGGGCLETSDSFNRRCLELNETGTRAQSFGNVAIVSYAASGALAIGALAWAIWPRARAAPSTGVRLLPEIHAGGGRVTLSGAW
ncbi:tetratricopeptide repeat protein [Sorangium sp. So ce426]|uniref:tetratricopeptide repeat protein n=1 Tax=Sorangium sp. So ce426 TaxID=3133312 RepID=UPI003F5B6CB4